MNNQNINIPINKIKKVHILRVMQQLVQQYLVLFNVLKLGQQFPLDCWNSLILRRRRWSDVDGLQCDMGDVFMRCGGLASQHQSLMHLVHVGLKRMVTGMIDSEWWR
ncbi:hypothetical protein INR49_001211 [Caranx melampygus]|nr:hypothetical protein INR49_001211 [Caranx melampygus]